MSSPPFSWLMLGEGGTATWSRCQPPPPLTPFPWGSVRPCCPLQTLREASPLSRTLSGAGAEQGAPTGQRQMLQGAGERCSVHPSTGGANFPKFPSRAAYTEIRPCGRAAGADAGQAAPRCSWQPRLPPTFPSQHRGCSRSRGAGGAPPGSDIPAVTPAGAGESWDPPKTHGAAAAGSQPSPFGSCCLQQHRGGAAGQLHCLGWGSWAAGPPGAA